MYFLTKKSLVIFAWYNHLLGYTTKVCECLFNEDYSVQQKLVQVLVPKTFAVLCVFIQAL